MHAAGRGLSRFLLIINSSTLHCHIFPFPSLPNSFFFYCLRCSKNASRKGKSRKDHRSQNSTEARTLDLTRGHSQSQEKIDLKRATGKPDLGPNMLGFFDMDIVVMR